MTIIAEGAERKTFPLAVLQKYAGFLDQLSNAISDVRSRCSSAGTAPVSSLPTIEIYAPTVDSQESRSSTQNTTSDEVYTCLGATGDDREYKPTPRQLERFRYEFGLFGENEDVYFTTVGSLSRAIPVFGKLALSQKGIMFSRKTAMVNRVKVGAKKVVDCGSSQVDHAFLAADLHSRGRRQGGLADKGESKGMSSFILTELTVSC